MSHWDAEDAWIEDGKFVHKATQDVEPILDRNKRLASLNDGYTPTREMRRAASIPIVILYQWMQEGVDYRDKNCWPEIRRRLNSPEWRHLRTAPGRL